jgi:RNA polymerase sigma factor (sigma-70 family)
VIGGVTASDTHGAIDAVWRIESAKLIAGLTRFTRDVGAAEDLAHDALVAALEQWPESGIPRNPGAWLMAAAKHRAIDRWRRQKLLERKHEELGREMEAAREEAAPDPEAALDDDVGDDLLRLVFTSCHPVLSTEARTALTLRLLCGLTTGEIARAFLTSESTVAQRIVRAKKTLAKAKVPFEVPRKAELPERLGSVLEVIYLVFNEGYSATAGDDWMRPALCEEALRLGRIVAELVPGEPEVHGLVALMEIQASRSRARVGPSGQPILLLDQNRALWDRLLIHRGLAALERAARLGGANGPYALQAAIAACHARALTADQTDWARIAALYQTLAAVAPSPIVELNRAVAVSMAFGPEAGLTLVDRLEGDRLLENYHLLPSVRGDLLAKLGRFEEARPEFERAARLTRNARERDLLLERAAACQGMGSDPGPTPVRSIRGQTPVPPRFDQSGVRPRSHPGSINPGSDPGSD